MHNSYSSFSHLDQLPVVEGSGEVGRGGDAPAAEELPDLLILCLVSRHPHPEVHILLRPEQGVKAVIAAAPEQTGERGLQGECPGPRQPCADHLQTLHNLDLRDSHEYTLKQVLGGLTGF